MHLLTVQLAPTGTRPLRIVQLVISHAIPAGMEAKKVVCPAKPRCFLWRLQARVTLVWAIVNQWACFTTKLTICVWGVTQLVQLAMAKKMKNALIAMMGS
jgi:hypothetical protein